MIKRARVINVNKTDEEQRDAKPPIQPAKYLLRGIVLPVIIIGVCAIVGVLISILNGATSLTEIDTAIQVGAAVGLILALFGVGEIVGALLGDTSRFMNGVYMSVGYLIIWAATLFWVLPKILG